MIVQLQKPTYLSSIVTLQTIANCLRVCIRIFIAHLTRITVWSFKCWLIRERFISRRLCFDQSNYFLWGRHLPAVPFAINLSNCLVIFLSSLHAQTIKHTIFNSCHYGPYILKLFEFTLESQFILWHIFNKLNSIFRAQNNYFIYVTFLMRWILFSVQSSIN